MKCAEIQAINISILITIWASIINSTQANNEPHVPGANGNLPIAPKVAIKWNGFLRSGKLFIIFKSVHIHLYQYHNLY